MSEPLLLLDRDLMDQQIIDVHGRKVVRVNDVSLALATPRIAAENCAPLRWKWARWGPCDGC